jgi:hypothetical protein
MTKRQKELLFEYRYNKLDALDNDAIDSCNDLLRHNGAHDDYFILKHFTNVIYRRAFSEIMKEVFELLKLN